MRVNTYRALQTTKWGGFLILAALVVASWFEAGLSAGATLASFLVIGVPAAFAAFALKGVKVSELRNG